VQSTALSFGNYDPNSASPTDANSLITVTCTPAAGNPLTTPYTLSVSGVGGGSPTNRALVSGSSQLSFQLYRDAARTSVLGNGSGGTSPISSSTTSLLTGLPGINTHTVYGRIFALQSVAPGSYSGTLTITVDY